MLGSLVLLSPLCGVFVVVSRVRNAISAHDVELQEQISSLGCKSMGRSICLWENPEHVYI